MTPPGGALVSYYVGKVAQCFHLIHYREMSSPSSLFGKGNSPFKPVRLVSFLGSYLKFEKYGKEQSTKSFPRRELNPGSGGESAESQPLDHVGTHFLIFVSKHVV